MSSSARTGDATRAAKAASLIKLIFVICPSYQNLTHSDDFLAISKGGTEIAHYRHAGDR